MSSTSRTIAKNASLLMASQLITWSLAILLTVLLPRYLGPASIGKYGLANSLLAITAIVASFGMETLMIKEVARSPARLSELFGTVLGVRGGFYLLGFAVLAVYVRLVGYPADTVTVIAIFCVSYFINQTASIFQSALQGLERMEFISLSSVVTKVFTVVVSITLLILKQGLLVIAAVSIASALVNFVILSYSLRRLQEVRFTFDRRLVSWIIKTSFPYMLSMAFLVIYQQVDTVIISLLVNEKTIGWYNAADQLFASMLFIPTIFMTAVFPSLARMYASGSSSGPKVVRKSFDLLLLAGIPIGLGLTAISDRLVVLLYGPDFSGSGPVLAVFGIVLIFTYLNILLGQYMVSIDRQMTWTIIMAVAAIATVPLDLVFVPWCLRTFGNGAIGGGLSFVVTELGMMIAGLWLIPRGILNRSNAWLTLRTLLAGLVMIAAVRLTRDAFFAIPILTGAAVYTGLILLMRIVPQEDRALLKDLFLHGLERLRRGRVRTASVGGE